MYILNHLKMLAYITSLLFPQAPEITKPSNTTQCIQTYNSTYYIWNATSSQCECASPPDFRYGWNTEICDFEFEPHVDFDCDLRQSQCRALERTEKMCLSLKTIRKMAEISKHKTRSCADETSCRQGLECVVCDRGFTYTLHGRIKC